mmetsp:Transcript_58785/g.92959  ORF Transcript_58785/g.92959 Transcript_58785/m.92959 type:complete len:90 (+) Transcript_58785:12-281(+)
MRLQKDPRSRGKSRISKGLAVTQKRLRITYEKARTRESEESKDEASFRKYSPICRTETASLETQLPDSSLQALCFPKRLQRLVSPTPRT